MRKTTLFSLLLCGLFALSTQAATYYRAPLTGNWSTLAEWQDSDNPTGSLALPGASDVVRMNNNRTVDLDIDATVANIFLVNNANDATVNLNTASATLTSPIITIGHATETGIGTMNVSAGTLEQTDDLTVNSNGTLNISGGTLYGTNTLIKTIEGAGTINVTAGTVDWDAPTTRYRINNALFSVSGGTVDLDTQVQFGVGAATEFRVTGDDAVINFLSLNNQSAQTGTDDIFRFVLDETGVSTITAPNFIHLSGANIVVDGSSYTGGVATITLFDSGNLASLADAGNISVSGFDPALDVSVVQSEADNDVKLLITDPSISATYTRAATGNWSTLSEWKDNSTGSFITSTELPGSNDTVVVNNNVSVDLDIDATVTDLNIVNNTADGTLNVNSNGTALTVLNKVIVGVNADGTAVVNQSDGTVSADSIQVGSVATGTGSGTYNLTGGTLQLPKTVTLNSAGLFDLDGGAVTNTAQGNHKITGDGTFSMSSGTFTFNLDTNIVNNTGSELYLQLDMNLFEISGGTLELQNDAIFRLGQAADATFRVVGDDAVINVERLQQANLSGVNAFEFVFDETGVSPINANTWVSFNNSSASISVDGSAYTGSAGSFALFDTPLLAGFVSNANITVTGFDSFASATVEQTTTNGVVLVLSDTAGSTPDFSGVTPVAGGSQLKIVLGSSDSLESYSLLGCPDLVAAAWTNVPHSDDGINPFIITNLSYSTTEGSNAVIYVETDAAQSFYGLGIQ